MSCRSTRPLSETSWIVSIGVRMRKLWPKYEQRLKLKMGRRASRQSQGITGAPRARGSDSAWPARLAPVLSHSQRAPRLIRSLERTYLSFSLWGKAWEASRNQFGTSRTSPIQDWRSNNWRIAWRFHQIGLFLSFVFLYLCKSKIDEYFVYEIFIICNELNSHSRIMMEPNG